MGDELIDRMLRELLRKNDLPSTESTMTWLEDRLLNSLRLAAEKQGTDRAAWLQDAAYYVKTLRILATLAEGPRPQALRH